MWDGPSIRTISTMTAFPRSSFAPRSTTAKPGKLVTAGPCSARHSTVSSRSSGSLGDGKLELITGSSSASSVSRLDWYRLVAASRQRDEDLDVRNLCQPLRLRRLRQAVGRKLDPKTLDGKAEIVAVNAEGDGPAGRVNVYSQDEMGNWTSVLQVDTPWDPAVPAEYKREGGGPPTIGDFDGDGFPEFAIAGGTRFRVFDFDCQGTNPACESDFVRWSRPSQDSSSKQTGGSAFDFDGDGAVEVVYADECFLRVYDGKTGDVKYSAYRTSATWYEGPVIADVNKDQSTKIVVNSTEIATVCPAGSMPGTPYVDPIHLGVRCLGNDDCTSKKCDDGLCRCNAAAECGDPGPLVSRLLLRAIPPRATPAARSTPTGADPRSAAFAS